VRVLGIAGSPRRGGNTDLLLEEFMKGAADKGAETKTILLRALKFETCRHCDACLKTGQCVVKDGMQDVYRELEQADLIVAASPVQFAGPTAHLKAMIDRCQCLWACKYVLKVPPLGEERERKGFFISVCGTKLKDMFEPSLAVVKTWFHILNIEYAGDLLFKGIDEKGAIKEHPDALKQAYEAGQRLAQE
jgi:multimeric flavodoxin WrbA